MRCGLSLNVCMIIGMDYYNQQVPIHCRVCGLKYRAMKSILAMSAKHSQPSWKNSFWHKHVWRWCQNSSWDVLQAMSALNAKNHQCHRKGSPLQMRSDSIWMAKTDRPKMQGKQYTYGLSKQTYDIMQGVQVCEHFHACSIRHMRRSTVVRGRQAGSTDA